LTDIGTDRDGRCTFANSPIGSHDRRKGRDGGHRIIDGVLLAAEAENGRGHSQGIHGRYLCGRRVVKDCKGGAGERSAFRQILGESNELGVAGQTAMQEEVSHFLESGVRSQLFNRVPGDGQPTRLPIDVAESR
jgi:hypothetical protein